jgi:hypothetical protein
VIRTAESVVLTVSGKNTGFFSACAGPDLHDRVFRIQRIRRNQQNGQFPFRPLQIGPQWIKLLGGDFPDLRVLLFQKLFIFRDLRSQGSHHVVLGDNLRQVGVLAHRLNRALLVLVKLRVRNEAFHLGEPSLYLFNFVFHCIYLCVLCCVSGAMRVTIGAATGVDS